MEDNIYLGMKNKNKNGGYIFAPYIIVDKVIDNDIVNVTIGGNSRYSVKGISSRYFSVTIESNLSRIKRKIGEYKNTQN
jgi:hypothetical protein